ncbi:MAG: hypothetical protein J6O88_02810 [Chryseobacterium sp.]|nr:hypothetical protein [Chryseobacterium sp.]MBO6183608.1 hypothetical protein [Chryseobacterium sp.]
MESVEYRDNWIKIKTIPIENEKSIVGWVYGAYLTPLNTCEIELNNDKYIKSKTKEYINDYVSYNSEKRFHLKQEMPLYKNHGFDSEIILSVTPDEKTIFLDMENLYFEDTKSGFWIAAENQSGQSGWLWFDCSN